MRGIDRGVELSGGVLSLNFGWLVLLGKWIMWERALFPSSCPWQASWALIGEEAPFVLRVLEKGDARRRV